VRSLPACDLDETEREDGCLLADDERLVWRTRVDAPVRAFFDAGTHRTSTVAPRGDVTLELRTLAPDTRVSGTLTLVDLGGFTVHLPLEAATFPALPTVAITEVRANPAGPEPAQEYVEILNYGSSAVDLAGFAISDAGDRAGDVFAAPAALAPGEAALVVADGFDPTHPDDPPVPPGVTLIRIGSSLATSGLANAGEPVFLRDAGGHRLSAAPSVASPSDERCVVRIGATPRDGDPSSFTLGPCTPGRATLGPSTP
jgi:hypothetical protein